MRATRVPSAQQSPGQRPAGEWPPLAITRGGHGPRPAPAGPGRLRHGDGAVETCPRHCDPGGSGLAAPWPSCLPPLPRR